MKWKQRLHMNFVFKELSLFYIFIHIKIQRCLWKFGCCKLFCTCVCLWCVNILMKWLYLISVTPLFERKCVCFWVYVLFFCLIGCFLRYIISFTTELIDQFDWIALPNCGPVTWAFYQKYENGLKYYDVLIQYYLFKM